MKPITQLLIFLAATAMGCSHAVSPQPSPPKVAQVNFSRPPGAPVSTVKFVVSEVLAVEGAPWCFIIGGSNRMGAYVTAKTEGVCLCETVQPGQWVEAAGDNVIGGGTFMVVVWADSVKIIDPPS